MVDLNGTGQKQLLVNNHETKDKQTGLYAYHVPGNLMTGEWTRETIDSNFHNAFSLAIPNMSPGFCYAVYPEVKMKGRAKAHIMIAGDGDHSAHILYPDSTANSFLYEDEVFADAKGTVGSLAFSDLDEDGWLEVWMPNYDNGYVELFKTSSASAAATFLQ